MYMVPHNHINELFGNLPILAGNSNRENLIAADILRPFAINYRTIVTTITAFEKWA